MKASALIHENALRKCCCSWLARKFSVLVDRFTKFYHFGTIKYKKGYKTKLKKFFTRDPAEVVVVTVGNPGLKQ